MYCVLYWAPFVFDGSIINWIGDCASSSTDWMDTFERTEVGEGTVLLNIILIDIDDAVVRSGGGGAMAMSSSSSSLIACLTKRSTLVFGMPFLQSKNNVWNVHLDSIVVRRYNSRVSTQGKFASGSFADLRVF